MSARNGTTSPYHDRHGDDNYSDDFDEDATNRSLQRNKTKSSLNKSDQSLRGRGRGRGQLSNSGKIHQEMKTENISRRVLSARRLKINEMQNKNQELLLQLKDLKKENKLLKNTQHIQEKNMQKFEERESELPLLIQRQHNEARSLRDQIRRWREKYEKSDKYLRDAEDELEKVKLKLKKLKSLADEKGLPERSELNNKLNKSEMAIEEKKMKIKELERYVINLEKNHKHEVGIERARMKEINKLLLKLKEENDKLSNTVKEKDKEIQVKNIYVIRAQIKPPHRLPNSYNGTPHGTPPPHHQRPSLSETDTITPREKSKRMEEKRRDELRRQREIKQQHDKLKREKEMHAMQDKEELAHIERTKFEQKQHEERELQERELEMKEQAEREAQERRLKNEREQMKREAEERNRLEQERKEHEQRIKQEKQEQEEREQREWEEREKYQKEERERWELEEREKNDREEGERRECERLEQEHRAAEERKKIAEDEYLQTEKKKKDQILQKLREIDEGSSKKKDKDKNTFNDPFFITDEREQNINSVSSRKIYTFSKPVENLHKGKPSHSGSNTNLSFSVGAGRKLGKPGGDDLDTNGYNPTFVSKKGENGSNSTAASKSFSLFDDDAKSTNTTAMTAHKTGKKSKLMEELFGSTSSPNHNSISFSEKPSKQPDQSMIRPSFLWDGDGSSKKQTLKSKKENSATLFGGGTALINEEELHKSNLHSDVPLPRKQKQKSTAFHNWPTVNAVSNYEDDIEEVIL